MIIDDEEWERQVDAELGTLGNLTSETIDLLRRMILSDMSNPIVIEMTDGEFFIAWMAYDDGTYGSMAPSAKSALRNEIQSRFEDDDDFNLGMRRYALVKERLAQTFSLVSPIDFFEDDKEIARLNSQPAASPARMNVIRP